MVAYEPPKEAVDEKDWVPPTATSSRVPPRDNAELALLFKTYLPQLSKEHKSKLVYMLSSPNTLTETSSTLLASANAKYAATADISDSALQDAERTIIDTHVRVLAPVAAKNGVLLMTSAFWTKLVAGHTCKLTRAGMDRLFERALNAAGVDVSELYKHHSVAFPVFYKDRWFAATVIGRSQLILYDPSGYVRLNTDDVSWICGRLTAHFFYSVNAYRPPTADKAYFKSNLTGFISAPVQSLAPRHSMVLTCMALEMWTNNMGGNSVAPLMQLAGMLAFGEDMSGLTAPVQTTTSAGAQGSKSKKAQAKKASYRAKVKYRKAAAARIKMWGQPMRGIEKDMLDRVVWACATGKLAVPGECSCCPVNEPEGIDDRARDINHDTSGEDIAQEMGELELDMVEDDEAVEDGEAGEDGEADYVTVEWTNIAENE